VTGGLFGGFILLCIILAGILVGLQSYNELANNPTLAILDWFVLIMFTVEVILKMLSEGFAPWRFFTNAGEPV